MKHLKRISAERLPRTAQDTVCGYLFVPSNTKCVSSNDPLAGLLKRVPVA